ncbi:MAG: HD domain-containing protein, partial [Deltaproteobacteria bacterium]|nr:HD domain-containing protein [Deltaproteobacteria bacterium]
KVEEGAKAAAEKALIAEASVHQGDTNISFFDLTKLGDFTVFQQWLALPRVSPSGTPDGIQVSVVPMKPLEASVEGQAIRADRKLQIVAIPNGRELPSQKGLLSALNAMNQAEVAKAEALGLTPKAGEPLKPGQLPRDHFEKLWFGKDNVILPNPMKGGSLLSPKEVSAILTDGVPGAKPLGLFESTDLSKQIDKLPPKSKHLVELMSAPYDVDGILVQPDVKPIVDLIRELGPDKIEAVLARGETSSENLSRLLDRATNPNFPGQAAAVRAYLKRASAEEILFLTDTKAMFVDRLANLKLEADGKSISVWELLTTESPYPYLEAVQQIAFPGVRDHVLAAMALREFYHATRTEAGAEFLAMFGIDPATHEHFPWTPQDNLERAALYVTVAKEKRNLLSDYQRAFPNVAKADLDAFVNDLWKTLRTQDVQDTHLPYTPHGWNHSLTVMHDSARIFDEAGPVREAIVAKLRPKYGDRAELAARELVKFIGIFHDTGYGCLHVDEHKGKHAEYSGDLFRQEFSGHMEKVFGIKSDDPLFNEIFLAIERHGADKPGKAEYLRASEKENPFLFVIRMADNLDLTNRRMRQVQLNQPLMAALKEMYVKGQDPNFQALEKPERKREIEKIQAKHAKAFEQAVKEGRMSRADADRNKKLLGQLNESTYPHFAGTEQVTGYRLIQDPASGQLTVEIELAGYARGQAIAESGLLVDHPLYQVLRTYIAAQSMTYGLGPDGRGLPIKFTYRETFRATTTDGHELPLQPDNVRDFEPKPQRPDDTNPPAAPAGAQALAVPEPQQNYFGYAVSSDFEIGLRNLVTADAGDPLFVAQYPLGGLVLGIRNLYRAAVGMEVPGFVSGGEEAGFPHNVHRHYFFSEDRGPVGKAGIYDKIIDVEAMQKRSVVEWDRIAVSYDSEGRTVFLYQKSFDSEIGVDSAGNRTKANTVVVSADGKIVTGFPAAEGGKDWVSRGELDAVGGDLAKLAAAKFRAGDAETRYAASLPDHPLVYRDSQGLRVAVYGDDVPVALLNRRTRANYLEKSAYAGNENEVPISQAEIPVTVKGKKNLRQVVTGRAVEMYFEQPVGYREVRKPDGSVERLPLHWNRAILNDKGELIGGYPIAERGDPIVLPEQAWNPVLREESAPVVTKAGSKASKQPKAQASQAVKVKRRPEERMLAAAVGGRDPVGGLGDGAPQGPANSALLEVPLDAASWSGVASALASQEIPLRDIPAGVTELPLYVGSPEGIPPQAGPILHVQDGVQRTETQLWGTLKREGEAWVYYPKDPGAEAVKDVGYAVKPLRPDGFVGLGEGDRLSLGFADFQYRDGRLVLLDDLATLNVQLSLRLPEGTPGRGGVDPKDSGGWGGGPTAADLQPPPKPEKPGRELTEFSEKMNRRRAALLEKLAGLGEVQGSAKKFSAADIEELAWLVAERGMDPQKLPRQVREALDEYMVAFVAEYGRLYPAELERKVNPFTGEALQRPNPKRPGTLIPAYDAQYSYLRSLANRDLGRPLFGEPSPREREALVNFVSRGMGLKVADYAEAQKVLRKEILARTPRAERALRAADPNLKYYALLSLRGDQAYLPLTDGAQGLSLVRFLGKIGFDQEVGVTVVMNGDAPEYRFLIGGWDHVLLQKSGERFLIHSHTKYFLNPKSQVMNKG